MPHSTSPTSSNVPEAKEESDWGCDFSTLMKTPSSYSHENSPSQASQEEKQKIVQLKASKIRDNSDEKVRKEAPVSAGESAKNYDNEKDREDVGE